MMDINCHRCLKRDKKDVKVFKIEFETNLVNEAMTEVLPDDDNTSGIYCIVPGCDDKYEVLVNQTYSIPNKRTFTEFNEKNPNGIPTYYYQKPEVNSTANGYMTA
jgi:hypothetical protein